MEFDDRAWVTISSEQLDEETLRRALIDNVNVVEHQEIANTRMDPLTSACLAFVIMHYLYIVPAMVSAEKVFEYLTPFIREKLKKFLAEGSDKDDGPGKTPITIHVTVNVNGSDNKEHESHGTIEL